MKITVSCAVCGSQLLFVEGDNLTQADADSYQENTSCGTDGTTDIVAVLEDE